MPSMLSCRPFTMMSGNRTIWLVTAAGWLETVLVTASRLVTVSARAILAATSSQPRPMATVGRMVLQARRKTNA